MTFSAQYGSNLTYYGNCQYGVWQPVPLAVTTTLPYGGWPYDEPDTSPMVNNRPIESDHKEHIEVIKRLKAALAQEQDIDLRASIRQELETARQEKVKAFQAAARIAREEDESTFMLLH